MKLIQNLKTLISKGVYSGVRSAALAGHFNSNRPYATERQFSLLACFLVLGSPTFACVLPYAREEKLTNNV